MTLSERVWQAFADVSANAMRLIPHAWRYPLAYRFSRCTAPLIGPYLMKRPARYPWSTFLDETLRATFRAMSRRGIPFDLPLRVDAPEDLAAVVRERGGLMVSAHFPLNAMVTTHLHASGLRPVVLRGSIHGETRIWGTTQPLDSILPNRTVLLTIRELLRERRPVIMVLDREEAEDRTATIDTPAGRVHIATPIFTFAKRFGVPLFWHCGRTDADGRPFAQIKRIEPALDAFAEELRRHIAALRR